ncbi:MAG: hypothetical protein QXV60_01670 [Nitrososphaerota archaeon]
MENIEKIIDSNQIFPIDFISLVEPILIPVKKIRSITIKDNILSTEKIFSFLLKRYPKNIPAKRERKKGNILSFLEKH